MIRMRLFVLLATAALAAPSFAQPAQQPSGTKAPAQSSTSCIAVKSAGSHAFRNIMLAGAAGALISKQQYEVVSAVNYPAKVGQKFHGNDLKTIQGDGTKVVILDKHYTEDDLQKACGKQGAPAKN